jgi:hypothetical protein
MAFGDELMNLRLPHEHNQWFSPRGRDIAADYLLLRAEATLRQELQRLAGRRRRKSARRPELILGRLAHV